MLLILLGGILGFLAGLLYVIRKRNLSLSRLVTATILGLAVASLYKIFRKGTTRRGRRYH